MGLGKTPAALADATLTRLADAILIPPFPGSSAPRWILEALSRGLAGVTLFSQNISTPDQVTALTASLRAADTADHPVIAIDEEGGDVTRVAYADGSPYPGNAALGAVDDTFLTRSVYQAIGADLTWSWWRWACRCGCPGKAPATWPPTARPGPAPRPRPNCSGWLRGCPRGAGGGLMPEKRWGTCIITIMRLSARADYALRAAIELAAASNGHVTADQLARAQQIPGKFLETILTQLRRVGLIRSQRGPDGGFWLARPAAEISLADIIRAIDGQLLGVRGERPENVTYPGVAEPLQQVWIALRANERAVLEQVSLADIVSGNLPDMVRNLTENPSAWV